MAKTFDRKTIVFTPANGDGQQISMMVIKGENTGASCVRKLAQDLTHTKGINVKPDHLDVLWSVQNGDTVYDKMDTKDTQWTVQYELKSQPPPSQEDTTSTTDKPKSNSATNSPTEGEIDEDSWEKINTKLKRMRDDFDQLFQELSSMRQPKQPKTN